ncbi:MAG TPA: hypothetical protein VI322_01440 [Candidatus Saccharimonadia bacterium]
MANVDFRLDDIKGILEAALVNERAHTKRLVDESIQEQVPGIVMNIISDTVPEIIDERLMAFWGDILEPAFEDVYGELGKLKHAVRQRA